MRARLLRKRLPGAGLPLGLGILMSLSQPAGLWAQEGQAAPSFKVLEVTTGSGSKSQDGDKPEMKIEVLDLTAQNPAAAAKAAAAAAAADPSLTPAQRAAKAREAALAAALEQWHSMTLAKYSYDIAQLQDPFMPIREVRGKPEEAGGPEGSEMASLPPVLRLELNQLKLVAITTRTGSGPNAALAAFEDGAGTSYILRRGDRIGRRQGRITEITPNMVSVEEPSRAAGTPARVTEIRLSVSDDAGLTRLGGQAEESASAPAAAQESAAARAYAAGGEPAAP